MTKWNGNGKAFKTYVNGDGKHPAAGVKVKGKNHILTYAEAAKNDCFGAILNSGIIDISFDDAEMGAKFLDMAKANNWRCLVLENQECIEWPSSWASVNTLFRLPCQFSRINGLVP